MSRNPWFRFYNRVLNDHKVQSLHGPLFKAWVNCMCIASDNEALRGSLPDIKAVAYALRVTVAKAEATVVELVAARLFEWRDGICYAHDWDEWQFNSDTSRERTAKWRAKRHGDGISDGICDVTVTGQIRSDTDVDKNREEKIVPASPKRGPTEAPKIFEVSEDMREWANTHGFTNQQIEFQTAAMLDHFRGNGKRKHDWPATWRNWLRNSNKWSNGNGNHKESVSEFNARAAEEVYRRLDEQSLRDDRSTS